MIQILCWHNSACLTFVFAASFQNITTYIAALWCVCPSLSQDSVLPLQLQANTTIAIIGDQAASPIVGGLGSGAVSPGHVVAPLWSFRNLLGLPQPSSTSGKMQSGTPECNANGTCLVVVGSKNVSAAAEAAKAADVALVFVGTTSTEGVDRTTLGFANDDALVSAVAASTVKSVVVAVAPGAFLTPWAGDVSGLVAAFMPGQEYAVSVARFRLSLQ